MSNIILFMFQNVIQQSIFFGAGSNIGHVQIQVKFFGFKLEIIFDGIQGERPLMGGYSLFDSFRTDSCLALAD